MKNAWTASETARGAVEERSHDPFERNPSRHDPNRDSSLGAGRRYYRAAARVGVLGVKVGVTELCTFHFNARVTIAAKSPSSTALANK